MEGNLLTQPEGLQKKPFGGFIELPVTPIAISSSEIRKRIAKGQSIESLTPEPVIDAILQKKLYAMAHED